MKSKHPTILDRARQLRKNMTPAEQKLWEQLRKKRLHGFKFRRQHILGDSFIVDFYCRQKKLIIEVDGSIHDNPVIAENDAIRQDYIEESGMKIIRFKNEEIFRNINGVIRNIEAILLSEE